MKIVQNVNWNLRHPLNRMTTYKHTPTENHGQLKIFEVMQVGICSVFTKSFTLLSFGFNKGTRVYNKNALINRYVA